MIVDNLENAQKYYALNPHFEKAFEALLRNDLTELKPGRFEIDGDNVYGVIAKGPGRPKSEGMIETHDKYIDIQFILSGTDTIGWKDRSELTAPNTASDTRNDVVFYDDKPSTWTSITPGMFGIYFPNDGHMPMISDGELHKVIVKVAIK